MTGLGHNSIIFMIECQAQLLINALREMWDKKAKTMEIKEEALNEFVAEWKERIDKSSWSSKNCTRLLFRKSQNHSYFIHL